MRVLVSAYACEPDRGSEEEVGLRAVLAAASQHDVWALTRDRHVGDLERSLRGRPEGARVHVVGLPESGRWRRLDRTGRLGVWGAYDWWQRRAGAHAVVLDRALNFDVVHHVTYSSYWTRAGVAAVDKPFVLGPVGGGVETPWPLLPVLGPLGLLEDTARVTVRRALAGVLFGDLGLRRSDVVLTQNAETARRVGHADRQVRLPHGTVVQVDVERSPERAPGSVVTIGRLIPWKATTLAVEAFRHVQHPEARLTLYASGPQRARVERAIARHGLGDRVRLAGVVPRPQLLWELSRACVLLHPALHDEGPITVAEALTLGTPVVALRHGGPAELRSWWPGSPATLVEPATSRETARRLAVAVDAHLASPVAVPEEPLPPRVPFVDSLLAAYDEAVRRHAAARSDP